jgi:hypothetical protein
MPSIKISDNLGLVLEIPPAGQLMKYLREQSVNILSSPVFRNILNKPLAETILTPVGGGLQFDKDVGLGETFPELTIETGLNGTIEIHNENAEVMIDELAGDSITVPPGQAFVGTSLSAHVGAGIGHERGPSIFGFEASSAVELQNLRSFSASQPVADAITASISEFIIPRDVTDLPALPVNGSVLVSGSGSLTLTTYAEFMAAPNPLAIPGLPAAVPEVAIRSGASVTVSASFRLGGGYEIRVRRLNPDTIRLGIYKKDEREFTVSVEASAGVNAGIGEQDWIPSIISAVSRDPQADTTLLEASGLQPDHIEEIQEGIRAGVQRSLEASLLTELSSLRTKEAAFLYDIDLTAAISNEQVRQAIQAALHGDLSLLPHQKGAAGLPQGITLQRSAWACARERGLTLRINLLGILNYATISKLLMEGTVVVDALTGEVTITDRATAKRLRALMVNTFVNQDKIRRLFFEAMIATVTYRASDVLKDVAVSTTHTYFELHQKTNRRAMKDNLDALEAVGLIDAARTETMLAHGESFGRSTLLLEASYDDGQCRQMFFGDDNKPRTEEWYEQVARRALGALIRPGDSSALRGVAAGDDALWKRLKSDGSPSGNMAILRDRFGAGAQLPLLAAIDGDFAFIAAFWAPAMHKTARKLDEIRGFLSDNPGTSPDDEKIQELRRELAKHLANVAKNTKERFGDPLGLVALHYASGRSGQVTAKLSCEAFTLALPLAAAAA